MLKMKPTVLISAILFLVPIRDATSEEITFNNVTFTLYTRTTNATDLTPSNLNLLDPSHPTVFITHGWESEGNTTWVLDLANAYLEKGDHNAIAVDWSEIAERFYLTAAASISGVGRVVGEVVAYLSDNFGLDLNNTHLVGHSLGAHVSGVAGKTVQYLTNRKVGRITGLDPAGPFFNLADDNSSISRDDAVLVVGLHTSGGTFGILGAVGAIDFFPNGGTPVQPGCLEELGCSHGRSHQLFIEAVRNSSAFVSTECGSYAFYDLGLCGGNRQVTLGGNLTIEDAGNYYFFTNSESPFSEDN